MKLQTKNKAEESVHRKEWPTKNEIIEGWQIATDKICVR